MSELDRLTSTILRMSISSAGEPPTVDYCPPTQRHHIDSHHDSVQVFWVEPKFADNVKVVEVTRTNVRKNRENLGINFLIKNLLFFADVTVAW